MTDAKYIEQLESAIRAALVFKIGSLHPEVYSRLAKALERTRMSKYCLHLTTFVDVEVEIDSEDKKVAIDHAITEVLDMEFDAEDWTVARIVLLDD